jgi:hypothetical protein
MDAPVAAAWSIRVRSIAKQVLVQSHRWAGIVLGLAAVMWFATGITMIYVGGMPRLTPQVRLDHLPVLDVSRVQLTPAQAVEKVGGEEAMPGAPILTMVQDRPAYRFPMAGNATVFADDGSTLAPIDDAAATAVARRFLHEPAPGLQLVKKLDAPDQWTLSMRSAGLLKFTVGDAAGTQLYVSARSAEVVQATTRGDRTRAWIATIPHWLYFTALRQHQPLWYRIVVWLSGLVCGLALLGLVLAFTQWRRTRPLDLKRAIPYRGGMRWHYITGALFGVFALTWAFSGLLSMEPFDWTVVQEMEVPGDAMTGGEPEMARYDAIDLAALTALSAPRFVKEVGYVRIHGEHFLRLRTSEQADAQAKPLERLHQPYVVGGRTQDGELLVHAKTLARLDYPFDSAAIVERLKVAVPGVPVLEQALLQDYDDYYYSRSRQAPLPVLRVKFADHLQTWLYIDPRTSQVVANVHRYSRVERWLYNGLHSLDFRFWYSKRPLWDIAMITLLLGGLVGSSLGLYYGIRRLVR